MIKQLLTHLADVTITSGGKVNPGNVIPKSDPNSVIVGVLNTAYFLGGVVAVIIIIVAGIMYSTSGGDSGKVAQAKDAILYAVVGLVVILMAFVITGFIIGSF